MQCGSLYTNLFDFKLVHCALQRFQPCSLNRLCLTARLISPPHGSDTSRRAPPLLRPILHRMLRPRHTRLFHARGIVVDIDRHHQVDRIAQPYEGFSALRLLVECRLGCVATAWMLPVEEGGVGVGD